MSWMEILHVCKGEDLGSCCLKPPRDGTREVLTQEAISVILQR